jgi:hypothetical protein
MYFSTSYLPSLEYVSTLLRCNEAYIEVFENYPKQTFRNRCLIASASGVQSLTVPIEKPDAPKCLTRDIRISEHGNWRHIHWHALISAYNLSPYFEYYADDFRPFYEKKYRYLVDYNAELLALVCRLLEVSPVIKFTETYEPCVVDDYRTVLTARNANCRSATQKPYYQVFARKNGFIANLSIVDLLFNMGNEAQLYI